MKIIFSDFDETMLDYYSSNSFSDDQLDVLRRVKDKNIYFCVVTGRDITFFDSYPKLMELVDFVIVSNGAAVYDVREKKFIYERCFLRKDFERVVRYAALRGYSFVVNSLGERYQYNSKRNGNYLVYDFNTDVVSEQVIIDVPIDEVDRCLEELSDIEGMAVNNVVLWESFGAIDVNASGVLKGNSVLWLCGYLDISESDAIGFGDGENDLSMFKVVGKSVAVENACDEVKRCVDEVTFSCYDGGIFRYIEDNILID